MISFRPDRRKFLKLSGAVAGSSLIIGINWSCTPNQARVLAEGNFTPNAWLRISDDESVTTIVAESEMGQGPYTLMPMMIAEELEVKWDQVKVERASVDPVYGYQLTGGSSSIRKGWATLRQAGAIAREILVQAAALKMGVSANECRAEKGVVTFQPDGKFVSYGSLVKVAQTIALPEQVFLKQPGEFSIIGTSVPRKDIPAKTDGSARFGIDVRLPKQLFATVVHCPVLGGRAKSIEGRHVLNNPAVKDVFIIDEGVAVVATDTWRAFKAAKDINIEWDYGERSTLSSEHIAQEIQRASRTGSEKIISKGIRGGIGRDHVASLKRQYMTHFQAHMTMEPMNCTAWFHPDGKLEIWAPTQSPTAAYNTAKQLTQTYAEQKLKSLGHRITGGYDDSIDIHTTLLGGGFGRRLKQDFVAEAVQIAQRFEQPVQLLWPREQDIQHDFYHPMSVHELSAELDKAGYPVSWKHIIKGAEVSAFGAQHDYSIASQQIEVLNIGKKIPKGPWRSVDTYYNIFAIEHFLDEIAYQGGHDPLRLRLKLLSKSPRLKGVLDAVANMAGWQGSVHNGFFYGVAAATSFGSHVAQAVKLKKLANQQYQVQKVFCAIDCGIVINPDIVRQQMEGSIIFGLSAATQARITLKNGRVEQSNFHDYPILRMHDIPEIEVFIAQNEELPGGIGEPAVPPLAPALANAIFADSHKTIAELPVRLS